MMAPEIHVEPTHNDGHRAVSTHCDEKEGCVLYMWLRVNSQENYEAGKRNADRKEGKHKAMLHLVRKSSYDHGEDKSASPRRNAV